MSTKTKSKDKRKTEPTEYTPENGAWDDKQFQDELVWIALSNIEPDPNQPRRFFNAQDLSDLEFSLQTVGQLAPIEVEWFEPTGMYRIIHGERRWRAAKNAALSHVQCKLLKKPVPTKVRRMRQLAENLIRSQLEPLEEARAFAASMAELGMTAGQLSAELGVIPARISRSLALLKLPQTVQALVESGELTPSAGYEISKLKSASVASALALRAVEDEWSRDRIAQEVRERLAKGSARSEDDEEAETRPGDPGTAKDAQDGEDDAPAKPPTARIEKAPAPERRSTPPPTMTIADMPRISPAIDDVDDQAEVEPTATSPTATSPTATPPTEPRVKLNLLGEYPSVTIRHNGFHLMLGWNHPPGYREGKTYQEIVSAIASLLGVYVRDHGIGGAFEPYQDVEIELEGKGLAKAQIFSREVEITVDDSWFGQLEGEDFDVVKLASRDLRPC